MEFKGKPEVAAIEDAIIVSLRTTIGFNRRLLAGTTTPLKCRPCGLVPSPS